MAIPLAIDMLRCERRIILLPCLQNKVIHRVVDCNLWRRMLRLTSMHRLMCRADNRATGFRNFLREQLHLGERCGNEAI